MLFFYFKDIHHILEHVIGRILQGIAVHPDGLEPDVVGKRFGHKAVISMAGNHIVKKQAALDRSGGS